MMLLGSIAKAAEKQLQSKSEHAKRWRYAFRRLQSAIGWRAGEQYRLDEVVDARQDALGVVDLS